MFASCAGQGYVIGLPKIEEGTPRKKGEDGSGGPEGDRLDIRLPTSSTPDESSIARGGTRSRRGNVPQPRLVSQRRDSAVCRIKGGNNLQRFRPGTPSRLQT